MKRMYAILFAVFVLMAVLVIGVVAGDRKRNRPTEEPSESASSMEETTKANTKDPEDKTTKETTSSILASLPFTSAYSFQAAKVKQVLGDNLLSVELYDAPDEAKGMDKIRSFDFTPFSATGSVDNEFLVYSFTHVYVVENEEFHIAGYDDIKEGDMLLCLEDYTNHRYILVYRNN